MKDYVSVYTREASHTEVGFRAINDATPSLPCSSLLTGSFNNMTKVFLSNRE